jgi:ribosomal protein S18 acetylase RimI-like enzyme
MTAYHAVSRRYGQPIESGVRPFDIGRDLRPVAELIADAFAHELDPRGSAALREMRIMSHVGALLKLLNRSTGEFDDIFGGFVWVEEGNVVGNVTVQKADSSGVRWQIANVAVAPAFRGRGISRQLMLSALDYIADNGGDWAVLQVYAQNQIARNLYQQLNFEEVGGNVDLRLERVPTLEDRQLPPLQSFSADQWQSLYELVNNQQSGQMQWWRPPRRIDFQITFEQLVAEWFWRTVGRKQVYRRCIQTTRRFDAAVVLTASHWRSAHQLQFWVQPDHYGHYEAELLRWALVTLQEYPRWPVLLTLSAQHGAGIAAARQVGFQEQQTLLTMRRKI